MKRLLLFIIFIMVIPTSAYSTSRLECLASNIYYESAGESFKGKLAVANVVRNRIKSKQFKNDYCGVIFEYKQFSWTLKTRRIKYDAESLEITKIFLNVNVIDYTDGALFYHVCNSKLSGVKWIKKNRLFIKRIGNHCFYH